MNRTLSLLLATAFGSIPIHAQKSPPRESVRAMRIAAAQPKQRLIDWRIRDAAKVLKQVDASLAELESLIDKAAAGKCDVIAFPEDTLGLGHWEAGNGERVREVLPGAVKRMLERFAKAAATHKMYVVCCNDTIGEDGRVRNTAFLLGRDGKQIGRYDKVNMPIHELDKKRGDGFPVFETKDLGSVGMLICYDMVFPEAARCLALGGADIIFHPTLGGAAIGDEEISRAAFRTRAVENFVYIVVAQRGSGSMIISPKGRIIAEAKGVDSLAIAEINPFGERDGGDAMNSQRDMRARLFRERSPEAFRIISDPNPAVLSKVPANVAPLDAVRIANKTLTVGEDEFSAAANLQRDGKTVDARNAFEKLCNEYPNTWIDRESRKRLKELQR